MEQIHFYGTTDKDALSYKSNELITFTVYPAIGTEIYTCKDIAYYKWEIQYDGGKYESGYTLVNGEAFPLILNARLEFPGFIRVIVEACDKFKVPLPNFVRFEGGAGVDVEKINLDTEIPDKFEEFWKKIKSTAENTDITNAILTKTEHNDYPDFEIFKFKIDIPGETPAQEYSHILKTVIYLMQKSDLWDME